jgi:hypothetical protein
VNEPEVFILQNEYGEPIGHPFEELEEAMMEGIRIVTLMTWDPDEARMPPPWIQEDEDVWALYGSDVELRIYCR